jgi:arginyl-tRNA synthetase
MIRRKIEDFIKKSEYYNHLDKDVKNSGHIGLKVEIETPERKEHGDYAAKVYRIEKRWTDSSGENESHSNMPQEDYEKIIFDIKKDPDFQRYFEDAKFAFPVFINFSLSQEYLQEQIKDIIKQGDKFGHLSFGRDKKVQVEFISANPTGPLTVGNARGGVFGDTLANVLKWTGFTVEKAYYINDYGMQILALGHSVLKDKEAKYKGDYIDYLCKRIKEKDPYKAGQKAARIIIKEMIKKTTERMGIKYDEWFYESELYKKGEVDKIIKRLEKKNLVYKKDGAIWFKSTARGDVRDRVLIKADGWKTYLAGDIAYHKYKFEDRKFDQVFDVWGADHLDDKLSLLAGIDALGHDKEKLMIPLLQFVTIFEKKERLKMSKRAGIYVTMDELLKTVGKDAVRFFFLTKSANTHLNFDLSLAKEQSEKNPVYYVQYAHARICSCLKKLRIKPNMRRLKKSNTIKLLHHPSELNIMKELMRFPEIIEDTAKDYQVQRIPQYATELAAAFHQFYRDCRVLTEEEDLKEARLALISATKQVLKNTLDLMGISTPERM